MGNAQDKDKLEDLEEFANLDSNSIIFTINGQTHQVNPSINSDFHPDARLVDYIRDQALLKGTKPMCREGGCGCCVVSFRVNSRDTIKAVNSCLVPLYSVDGWDIKTIESLGTFEKNNYHQIQRKLVQEGGTQCGFCSPGMCMNMYSLVEGKRGNVTKQDVEDSFDGNICRCTGYRPILQAFKSISKVQDDDQVVDNDDDGHLFDDFQLDPDATTYAAIEQNREIQLKFVSGQMWIKPNNLQQFFEILRRLGPLSNGYRIIAGNTSQGIYPDENPYQVYIDIKSLPQLRRMELNEKVFIIGSCVTIFEWIEMLKKATKFRSYNSYANQFITHLQRVANTPVRNVATIGGNLMIKNLNNEFPSDIFTLLESIGCKLVIYQGSRKIELNLESFLQHDMSQKLLGEIHLPQMSLINPAMDRIFFKSFKISRRYQNSHAYVNMACLIRLKNQMVQHCSIVYGGINPKFIHAKLLESFLIGKNMRDGNEGILKAALDILEKEIKPDWILPDASPEYRSNLSLALFYKIYLTLVRSSINNRLKSGSDEIRRGISTGEQNLPDPDRKFLAPPLGLPLAKYEGHLQASGEAEYVNDMPFEPNELIGFFVMAQVGKAEIVGIDPSQALKVPGVVDFISAKDVPGKNEILADLFGPAAPYNEKEEIFASKKISHAGQSVGLILAINREAGREGVRRVKISYKNIEKPILDFDKELYKTEEEFKKLQLEQSNRIRGQLRIGAQYHMHMETQVARIVPKENGTYDLFLSSQWMNYTQNIVADALGISANCITASIKRVGGAFGAKISRCAQIAAAAGVAAYKTRRPVRIALDLETNMRMIGKRPPYLINYDVTIDPSTGKVLKNDSSYICDSGYTKNENTGIYATFFLQSCYKADNWKIKDLVSNTDTHSNTWCRSPGSIEAIVLCETIMEHIANALNKDPMEIREVNYLQKGDNLVPFGTQFEEENMLPIIIEEIKASGGYTERVKSVEKFNQENRWKKRGLNLLPIRFPIFFFYWAYNASVSVYHLDGSVSVSHHAVEMGQGVNTKVVQVVAATLGIPLEKVKIRTNNNHVAPNGSNTGGSISTNLTTYTVLMACENLLSKMKPIKDKLGPNASWFRLVDECFKEHVDMTGHYRPTPKDDLESYSVWAVILTEVQIDVLTGENKIVRVDMSEDCGKSLNPLADLGQIEGALVMGFGYWLTEKIVYDPENGQNLTHGTWNYKVPLPRDIPEDFRVTIRKNTEERTFKGTLGAKGVGEPPICLAFSVIFALRQAINEARKEIGAPTDFYRIDTPLTPEDILRLCMTTKEHLTL